MAIWPDANAFSYSSHSASAIPSGMLNIISHRLIHIAIRESQGMAGNFNTVISLSFWFCIHPSPSVISIMPASICHPMASFLRTGASPQPEFTKVAIFTRCSVAPFSLFNHLLSFHHGLQAMAVLITPIKQY